jgi:deoxyribose-phosphate aldolase
MFAHEELKADFSNAMEFQMAKGNARNNLVALIDSTVLKPESTLSKIETLCQEAHLYAFRAVCVSPCYVLAASNLLKSLASTVRVCTVVGFPNGVATTASKVFETKNAVENAAHEIDYVQNNGWVKDKRWDLLETEAAEIVKAAKGALVKIILETSLLTEEEIRECATRSALAGVHVIKTSTGFGSRGALPKDIEIIAAALKEVEKKTGRKHGIKASGGVRSFADARTMVELGATRLGTSGGASIADGSVSTTSY